MKNTLCTLAVAMTLWTSAANARSNALPVGPAVGDQSLSPFYIWDSALPQRPGVMLREESIPRQPDITDASKIQRILYTSQDKRWNAGSVPVSGTLWFPQGETPKGGWPVIAPGRTVRSASPMPAPPHGQTRPLAMRTISISG